MNSLISINSGFMDINPIDLIWFLKDKSSYIKGIEIYINNNIEKEKKYLEDLVYACLNNDFILSIHGESNMDKELQIKYLKEIEKYSDILGYQINVTLHPLFHSDKENSINDTIDYMNYITDNIDNTKIKICLENLNYMYKQDRLHKEDIANIILNNENLFMTYDIGHEIIDNGDIININNYLINEISNIHIHTFDYEYDLGYDHKPIFKNDKNWEKILKAITYLKINKYEGNIVFEYALTACEGNDFLEKLETYLRSIDFISEMF